MKQNHLKAFLVGMLTLFSFGLYAQVNVTGTVKSEGGEFLPGVTIQVKGTATGAVTDLDGKYTINVPDNNSVLVFSFVGYLSVEEEVQGRSVIDVTLVPDLISLDEVVVTALGISRNKKALGYSVEEVEGEALQRVASDNVLNSLAGKVAGVTINQTGIPGSSVSVVVRGATSLTTDNQPLFVVDGVPMSNSLNNISSMGDGNAIDYGNAISDINAEDIESISVLKGPSAAALYGTRAGNGVIIITTKSAKNAKGLGISVSSNTLFEVPTRLLDFHYKYANGERNGVFVPNTAYWGGPELDAGNQGEQWPNGEMGELRSYPDNMKEFLNTGVTSTNSVALSNGSENGNFRVSYTNMSLQGMIPNHDRFNNSLKSNINYNITDKFTFTSNISIARTNSNDIPSTGDRRNNPLEALYTVSYIDVNDMKDYWVPGLEGIEQQALPDADNPYFIAYGMTNAFVRDRVYGNASLSYQLFEDFSITGRYALDAYHEERETKIPFSASRMPRGNYSLQNLAFQETNADVLAEYKKMIGDIDINLSVGGNIMKRSGSDAFKGSGGDRRNGLTFPGLYNVSNIPLTNLRVSNSSYEKAIYSAYALASIGFKNMVYIDVTGRNDWSSTLPEENRSYFYPSASLSWLASNTFELPSTISLLKFRGGWAKVGNDTDPYRLETSLNTGNWNQLTTQSTSSTLLTPNLKPEEAISIEAGLDINLFSNRLRFAGTYYTVDNKNQIYSVALPRSSGYSSQLVNAGLITSEGWEFLIGGTPIKNIDGFTWDINLNFSNNTTTVEEIIDGLDRINLWTDNGGAVSFVGDKIGDIYSHGYAHVKDPSSKYYLWPILDDEGGQWIELEDNVEDWVKVGNFNPDFLLGAQTSVSYKRWSISASIDWRKGGEFLSYTYRYGESDWKSQRQIDQLIPGSTMSTSELVALLTSNPGEYIIPQNGLFPRVGGHTAETGGFYLDEDGSDGAFIPGVIQTAGQDTPDDFSDDEYIENLGDEGTVLFPITDSYPWGFNQNITFDASFVKLRELSVTYQLPDLPWIKNASISVYTRNLMLWTAADIGIDPERAFQANSGSQGNTASNFKQGYERQNVLPWSFSGGVKLNFNF